MAYNPIRKIKDEEFSWKEDYHRTLDDLSKVYKAVGLEKVMSGMENVLGKLDKENKTMLTTMYLASLYLTVQGTAHYMEGLPELGEPLVTIAGVNALIGLYHHFIMGDRKKSQPMLPNKN